MIRFRRSALRAANALSATASAALVLLIVAGPRATTLELAAFAVTCLATALTGALIHRNHRTDHEENDR